MTRTLLIVAWLSLAACSTSETRVATSETQPAPTVVGAWSPECDRFRPVLEAMATVDQAVRANLTNEREWISLMSEVDGVLSQRLERIVAQCGWPTVALAGERASEGAFLVLQHTRNAAFASAMLPRLEQFAASREISPEAYTLLYDRIAVRDRRSQRWGTQFNCNNGEPTFPAIEDPPNLDARRSEFGLGSFADYTARARGICQRLAAQSNQ